MNKCRVTVQILQVDETSQLVEDIGWKVRHQVVGKVPAREHPIAHKFKD
jgi:hypothetical protein